MYFSFCSDNMAALDEVYADAMSAASDARIIRDEVIRKSLSRDKDGVAVACYGSLCAVPTDRGEPCGEGRVLDGNRICRIVGSGCSETCFPDLENPDKAVAPCLTSDSLNGASLRWNERGFCVPAWCPDPSHTYLFEAGGCHAPVASATPDSSGELNRIRVYQRIYGKHQKFEVPAGVRRFTVTMWSGRRKKAGGMAFAESTMILSEKTRELLVWVGLSERDCEQNNRSWIKDGEHILLSTSDDCDTKPYAGKRGTSAVVLNADETYGTAESPDDKGGRQDLDTGVKYYDTRLLTSKPENSPLEQHVNPLWRKEHGAVIIQWHQELAPSVGKPLIIGSDEIRTASNRMYVPYTVPLTADRLEVYCFGGGRDHGKGRSQGGFSFGFLDVRPGDKLAVITGAFPDGDLPTVDAAAAYREMSLHLKSDPRFGFARDFGALAGVFRPFDPKTADFKEIRRNALIIAGGGGGGVRNAGNRPKTAGFGGGLTGGNGTGGRGGTQDAPGGGYQRGHEMAGGCRRDGTRGAAWAERAARDTTAAGAETRRGTGPTRAAEGRGTSAAWRTGTRRTGTRDRGLQARFGASTPPRRGRCTRGTGGVTRGR